jgi:hypothetical protein
MKRKLLSLLLLIAFIFPGFTPQQAALAAEPGDVIINEIMQNPAAVSDSAGEWFELYNPTTNEIDIEGWTIRDDDIDNHVIANGGPLVIPAGGYLVLGNNTDQATNGGAPVAYSYGSSWFLSNSGDEVIILDNALTEIDRVEYDGGPSFPDPNGASMALRDPALDNNAGGNWCTSITSFGDGDFGTPGGLNDCPPAIPLTIQEIQFTTDPGGASPYEGQYVTTQGVVTAFFGAGGDRGFFIQDGPGAWSGLYIYEPDAFLNVGDLVEVTGFVSEYFGLTEIAYGNAAVISTDNWLAYPEVLPTGDVNEEQWESVLVRVEDVTVTDEDLGFGEWLVDDTSGGVRVDDLGGYLYTPEYGDLMEYIQGPLNYSFGDFKIEPREDRDISVKLTIGKLQGVVSDTDDGTAVRSPYAPPSGNDYGQTVVIQGVIYQKTLARASWGGSYYGFFIQSTAETADGDPLTSDGVFVFNSTYSTLRVDGGGYYAPQVGDEVILRGPVVEYYNLTQLSSPYLLEVVQPGVVLDDELPPFEIDPPDELDEANRYWERHEGMRSQVPSGSIVLNGRDVFASSLDGEVWVARGDSAIAQRDDPYARRAFRDAHPLDDIPDQDFDNGNGYRIVLGSLGVKAATDDNTTIITPARTFDTMINAPVGGVYYSFGKYQIQVEEQPLLDPGADPALNAPPQAFDRLQEYSIVTFNVENLYDYVDDPFDGCDFHDNPGCPGVYPPFDYVPPSDEVYQARLQEIAMQIIDNLHSPDIIMAQEAEDQDVCLIIEGEYTCPPYDDRVNNADGKPDTLQELAQVIYDMGGPIYDAALDRDGADDRGIISGYLYRTDRVELLPAAADDPVLGDSPTVVYDHPGADPLPYNYDVQNPKVLNAVLPDFVTGDTDGDNVFTRPPQVALFRIWRQSMGMSVFQDVYLSDNHFSSGPDGRVGQRTEQANYNAAIIDALQTADPPNLYVSVGGDLNVYPRPDDPFPPPYTSDQLAGLYNQGLINLYDILVNEVPASAYTYVYQGQAQTLDQMFASDAFIGDLSMTRIAHINSDWPADYVGDGPRGTSDHDPHLASYTLLPTLDRMEDLVHYFDASGDILGNKTTKILLDRIERARRFQDAGQQQAYEDQLRAFISQVQDLAPEQITQFAADVLSQEAMLLLSLTEGANNFQVELHPVQLETR